MRHSALCISGAVLFRELCRGRAPPHAHRGELRVLGANQGPGGRAGTPLGPLPPPPAAPTKAKARRPEVPQASRCPDLTTAGLPVPFFLGFLPGGC